MMRLTYRIVKKRNWGLLKRQASELIDYWNINYTSRRDLRELDVSRLEDIGIDRLTAEQEAKKPFWRK